TSSHCSGRTEIPAAPSSTSSHCSGRTEIPAASSSTSSHCSGRTELTPLSREKTIFRGVLNAISTH
ncbi:MAG: hypothetical protein COB61_008505, partial [Thiotrichales bacterium]|nr:hypothetical protein [Thiotrichales bacterium]